MTETQERNEPDGAQPEHVPVLLGTVLEYLNVPVGGVIVDATVGLGGHSAEIAKRLGPSGRLIAIDQDAAILQRARKRVSGCQVEWVHGNFARLRSTLDELGVDAADGVLADLGVSSPQLDTADRGFSFRLDGPLDMRMDASAGESAARLIARLSEKELARIFWEFGEERHSRRIAKRIVEECRKEPVRTTTQLAEIVRSAIGHRKPSKSKGAKQAARRRTPRIDPATRVFQALRIAVNDELGSLDVFLDDLPDCVRRGGRAVVISFHSLEDRRVKHALRNKDLWKILTKRPHQPTEDEISANPRARSAKLRAAERT